MSLQNGTKGFSFSGNSEMGMQFTELQPDAFKVKKIFDLLIGGIVYSDLISEFFQVWLVPGLYFLSIKLIEYTLAYLEGDAYAQLRIIR